MKRVILVAAAVLLTAPAFGKTVAGSAEFSAKAVPGFLSIPGKGAAVGGEVVVDAAGVATGTLTADLAGLKTGMDMRDEHMKKYLGTATTPEAKLVLNPWKVTDGESEFSGMLTIKGDTKPVKGTASVQGEKLAAKFTVKISDYPSIGAPIFKGVGVQDEVAVSVSAVAK